MQAPTIEKLPGSKVKLVFTVTPEEADPYVQEAVSEMSISKSIPGFRPGKAPYAEVAKAFSEMRIWEAALERIVRARYMHAILENDLDTVGSPEVQVDKLTPKQTIQFTVIAPVAPIVEKLADYKKERVTFSPRAIEDADIEKAIKELRMMQRKEAAKAEPATMEDIVVIDLDMTKDHVALEDGAARDYKIYLNEPHYIPGFADQIVGMKTGDEKTFSLPFPSEHYQKHLAGQNVDFAVKAKGVFSLELPELNDEFAKSLGQKDIEQLKDVIRKNLTLEEESRAAEKAEIELLEKLVDESSFSDAPDLLVNDEIRKMMAELERTVDERHMKMDDYLASIKKTRDELKLELVPQAIRRIRAATIIKAIAKVEGITVSEDDADTEIDRILSGLRPDDTQTRERVSSPEYREYVAIMMRNRKTLDLLHTHGIKGYPVHTEDNHGAHVHGEHCQH
jgi:trigger factor